MALDCPKEEAKKALNDFVDGFLQESETARSFLNTDSPGVDTAAKQVGENVGENVVNIHPIFSQVTDPIQKALLDDALVTSASNAARQVSFEDTINKIDRIFEEGRSAALNLFSVGSDFFYDAMSKNAERLRKAIAAAVTSGAELQALAVSYNAFHQSADRSDLDNLDSNKVAQVRSDALFALRNVELAIQEGETNNAIKGSTIDQVAAAVDSLCGVFTNTTGIVGLLMMERILKAITDFNSALNKVIGIKTSFEEGFNNTLNANFVNPITRTLNTVNTELKSITEKATALLGKPSFDKFTSLTVIHDLCLRMSVLSDLIVRNPEQAKTEITLDVNYSTFEPATVDIAGQTNETATDYIEFSGTYRQVVQTVMIQDVRPQLDARTTELISKIGGVQAWLAAQGAILTALPIVQSALTTALSSIVGVDGLGNVDSVLKSHDFKTLADMQSNNASKAGNAAAKMKECIESLPPEESDKFTALTDVRSDLLAVEQTQALAAEDILNETPAAIGQVDSLTRTVKSIKERGQALLS